MTAPYSALIRILHWSIFACFVVLAYTETMNMYFFSKEAIMKSFEFSFSALGYQDIPPLDRLFIARLERRDGWMWHYYAGIGFVILSGLRFILFMFTKKKRYKALHIAIISIVSIQFVTGYSLWAYPHIYEWQIYTRAIHHYTIWALYVTIGSHILWVLWLEISGRGSGVVSRMIGGVHPVRKGAK